MARTLVLASASEHRRRLLEAAGVEVEIRPADLDERALEAPLKDTGALPEDYASVLAEAKATEVSEQMPEALVIGADQTLSLGGELLHKPASMEEARRALLALSGRTHELHSAVVLAERGEPVFRHVETARITFRSLTPAEIGRYLAAVGDVALSCVGSYQIEGRGLQLMERVDGDFFSIVGLPMLPLLKALRERGALDA